MITLFWPAIHLGEIELDGGPAQHARVRRVEAGDPIRLVDGAGTVGRGSVESLTKHGMALRVQQVDQHPRPATLELVLPVADRDRMLLAAEKCVELQVTAWRPAYFARSRSVSPRGEGDKFHEKVRARMQSALEQSGGAWLPSMHPEAELHDVLGAVTVDERVLLDSSGTPLPLVDWQRAMAILIGPEGGLEDQEIEAARRAGWRSTTLGASTLRFETAIIAAAAVVRAAQLSARSS